MASTLDLQQINLPEIIESVTALIAAPVVLPIAAAVKQPLIQDVIKSGIALSEQCKEAVAQTGEIIENLAAEVNTQLIEQNRNNFSFGDLTTPQRDYSNPPSIATDLTNIVSVFNTDIKRATNGVVDLRLLLSLGLSTLAIRQLVIKGLQIDEIPWYTLAWYAFDSFTKFDD